MKIYLAAVFIFLNSISSTRAQQSVDPNEVGAPADGIDYEGCYDDIHRADVNGDGKVKIDEFLNLINLYGRRICYNQKSLTDPQRAAFNQLACRCEREEGSSPECCIGRYNAHIDTDGANLFPSQRTDAQKLSLRTTCIVIDGTIGGECPPTIKDPVDPPIFLNVPVIGAAQGAAGGLSTAQTAGIIVGAIAAALLLLLCCCCLCVVRRRRAQALEEEEEEENIIATKKPQGMEMHPESTNEAPPPDEETGMPFAAGVFPPDEEESEYIEEEESESDESGSGRGRRGQNFVEDEPPDTVRRFGGEGPLPEPGPREPHSLKPIPDPEPEEDPEWDQPARHIEYPKEEDEMSAQEFEPYIPDGGVYDPQRPEKKPIDWKRSWERTEEDDPDETDNRKHRIQSGLGEGEVWDKLNEADETEKKTSGGGGDVFDWVVQSALGVLDKADENATS